MKPNFMYKGHAVFAVISITLLAIMTVVTLTNVPIINANHLFTLAVLALSTWLNLWRFEKLDAKINSNG